ncbi:MAG: hypothetical protein LBD07_04360 [Spirochaetaceae bacterium]|jgi:hypothetical protein|nr:hypothetical protein [Spirochaetaceae bacterium]
MFLKKTALFFLIIMMTSCGTMSEPPPRLGQGFLFISGVGLIGGAVAMNGGDIKVTTGKDPTGQAMAFMGCVLLIFSAVSLLE